MQDHRASHFKTLDGIRGVAALAVILHHAVTLVGVPLAPSGYLAVDLFFALSGFVLAHAYEQKLQDGLSIWRFMAIRAIRFYPLYILGLGIGLLKCIAVVAMHQPTTMPAGAIAPSALLGALFIPAPLSPPDFNLFPLNIPAWSLFFELLVNALFAIALVRVHRSALLLALLICGAYLMVAIVSRGNADFGTFAADAPLGAVRTFVSFGMGMWIYHWKIKAPRLPPMLLCATCGLLLVAPDFDRFRSLYDAVFIFIASPTLLILGTKAEPQTKIQDALCHRLGLFSFFAYAVHYPLLWLARGVAQRMPHGLEWPMLACLVAGLFIAAPAVDRMYDRPFRKLLTRILPSRQLATAASGGQ